MTLPPRLGLRWRRCRLALGFFWSGKSAPTSSSPIRAPCENVSSPPGDGVSRPRTRRAPRRAGNSNSTRNPQLRIDGISFVTLSTVAYILPLTGPVRGLAALEGIVGQFWPYWSPALSDCTLSTVSGEIQIVTNALDSTMARSANGSDRAAADWRAWSRPPRACLAASA
jgi:hypothetical protein